MRPTCTTMKLLTTTLTLCAIASMALMSGAGNLYSRTSTSRTTDSGAAASQATTTSSSLYQRTSKSRTTTPGTTTPDNTTPNTPNSGTPAATAPAAEGSVGTAAADRPSGLYVRATNGSATIGGRRVTVRSTLWNDYMPPVNVRQAGLGNLSIVLERNDPRGLPTNITKVTAEITQGRLRWKGTLTPFISEVADTAMPSDLSGPTFTASGVRTFPAGTKVTVVVTIRANGRDTNVTLRNVEVGAAY